MKLLEQGWETELRVPVPLALVLCKGQVLET